jgi:pimeloyl-ACP methyl ester carboxylesterase
MKKITMLLSAVCALSLGTALPAQAEPDHTMPQGPARVRFGADFPKLIDHEWNFALGGFGGVTPRAALHHVPVIFVHGNNVDAADWYVVRDDFKAAGWTDQELFGLSYNGLGGNNGFGVQRLQPERDQEHLDMGYDGVTRVTNNEGNVPDLYDFITAVRAYTGSSKFALVSHSLGVTLARRTLKVHPELRADLVGFVGIAGGNHGTSFCPPGSEGNVVSCNEIAANTPWLAALNGAAGADETYTPAKWLTIYDGSGAGDPAYAGPTYAQGPLLKGADNRQFAGRYHNDLRIDADIVTIYRQFLEQAEKPYLAGLNSQVGAASAPRPAATTATNPSAVQGATTTRLPATGGALPLGAASAVLGSALMFRRAALARSSGRPRGRGRRG